MKKLGFLFLTILLSATLVACSGGSASSSGGSDGDTYKIVAAHSTAENNIF